MPESNLEPSLVETDPMDQKTSEELAEQYKEPEFIPTDEDKRWISMKAKEYRMQGASDEDADRLATEDCKKVRVAEANANETLWNEVTKKVNLADFLDDQIRRALGVYKANYLKKYPEFTLDFALKLKNEKGAGGRLIAACNLELSFAVNGNWQVWMNKRVQFKHIREINNAHQWKLALYEAMLSDIVGWGATYCLHVDAVKSQKKITHDQATETTK